VKNSLWKRMWICRKTDYLRRRRRRRRMVMMMMMTGKTSNKCCENFLPQVRQPKIFDLLQRKFVWNIYTKFRQILF